MLKGPFLAALAAVAAASGCANQGPVVEMVLDSMVVNGCDCGSLASTRIQADFRALNTGDEAGRIEPLELRLYDLREGGLLTRYGPVDAIIDSMPPAPFDGSIDPSEMLPLRFSVTQMGFPSELQTTPLSGAIDVRVDGAVRSFPFPAAGCTTDCQLHVVVRTN